MRLQSIENIAITSFKLVDMYPRRFSSHHKLIHVDNPEIATTRVEISTESQMSASYEKIVRAAVHISLASLSLLVLRFEQEYAFPVTQKTSKEHCGT